MARMIPELEINELDAGNLALFNGDVSERAMYRALKEQLPADWVVRYNYVFCYWRAGKLCPDGQADFIVAAPGSGLMFVEVKGASGLECRNGQYYWLNEDGGLGKETGNPFQQAQGNKHEIVNILCKSCFGKQLFPGRYGHLVAFPRARGIIPVSHMEEIAIRYADMSDLLARIECAFGVFGTRPDAQSFTPPKMSLVVEKLEDKMRVVPVAAADVDDDKRKIEALTKQQWDAFKGILGNRRVKVTGVAGSGKTMLALWTAEKYASDHHQPTQQKVLYLCYNKLLKKWIELTYPAETRRFDVETFHSLTGSLCALTPKPFHAEGPKAWTDDAPAALLDAIDLLGEAAKYDAVIVDDAQDFHSQWWTPLEFILRSQNSVLLSFSDPRQNLYVENSGEVSVDTVFDLSQNCRNTKEIAEYCGEVICGAMRSFDLSPKGPKPTIRNATPQIGQRRAIIREVVNEWLHEGFKASQIAILSPWSQDQDGCSLKDLGSVANMPVLAGVTGLQQWRSAQNGQGKQVIFGDTIKSFKGLEADCVVISDLPCTGVAGYDVADLYVAASRAKHRLVLIPTNQDAATALVNWL
jgi:hypothetical protein